ncbi:helix-turn-helix domain-containing protein [Muricauda sp. ANG21]|uniref:helix-turn-helix domain-containing protein n=1 Tax=Allomuricauda sp. ANG21 TaxID=3042468 RepID=UPI0034573879
MAKIELRTFEKSDFDLALEEAFEKALKRAVKEFINPPKSNDSDMFSRKETAKFLRISLPTLHDWTKEGLIRAYRIGNRVLYKKADIDQALNLINPANRRGGLSC